VAGAVPSYLPDIPFFIVLVGHTYSYTYILLLIGRFVNFIKLPILLLENTPRRKYDELNRKLAFFR